MNPSSKDYSAPDPGNWVLFSHEDRGNESHPPQGLSKGPSPSKSNYSTVSAIIKEAKEVTPKLSLLERANPKHLNSKWESGRRK